MYQVTELKDLVIDPSQPVFVDTETGGTKTITKEIQGKVITTQIDYAYVVTVQVYQTSWDKVKVFYIPDLPSYALEFIWSQISKALIIGHNFLYDLQMFDKAGVTLGEFDYEDTFYASRLRFPVWQEYALDKCLTKVLGYDPYSKEGLIKKEMQKSFSPDSFPTPSQLIYGAIDVFELPKLWDRVKSVTTSFIYILDKLTALHAIDTRHLGMPVDVNKLMDLDKECIEEIQATKETLGDLNVNSYLQVRKLLGLQYSSDETTFNILSSRAKGLEGYTVFKHPKLPGKNLRLEPNYVHSELKAHQAKEIVRQRKNLKMRNFVQRALKNMGEDHRIQSHFSPHAITGRVQGKDENISQYPRSMKKMWGINKEIHGNRILVYADYSQLELRTICAILPERNMEEAYRNKVDLHTYAASSLNVDEAVLPKAMPKRTLAKYLNFLMLYGGGVANFQATVCKNSGVFLEFDVCKKAAKDWKDGFSDIKSWHERNAKSEGHQDSTVSGRRYKAKNYTDLNNIKVQGSGAEVAKLAWHYLYKYNVLNEDVRLVNFVHDAYVLDVPDDPAIYEDVAEKLSLCMKFAWQQVMQNAPIKDLPMPVTTLVGYNWEDLEYETNVVYRYDLDGDYDNKLEEKLNGH